MTSLGGDGRQRESAPDRVIVTRSSTGVIDHWSAEAARCFGFDADEVRGAAPRWVPEKAEAREAPLRGEVSKGGIVPPFESARLTKAGRLLRVTLALSPRLDSRGRIVGIQEQMLVHPKRLRRPSSVQQQMAGRVSEEFERITGAPDDVGFTLDDAGRLVTAEPGLCALLECGSDTLLGRRFVDLFAPDARDEAEAAAAAARVRGRLQDVRLRLRGSRPTRWVTLALRVEPADPSVVRGWLRETRAAATDVDLLLVSLSNGALLVDDQGRITTLNDAARGVLPPIGEDTFVDEVLPGAMAIPVGGSEELFVFDTERIVQVTRAALLTTRGPRAFFTLVDLSPLLHAETDLRVKQHQLREALEASDLGVWRYEPTDERLEWTPPGSWRETGAAEVDPWGLFDPDSLRELRVALRRANHSNTPFRREVTVRLPDESLRRVVLRGSRSPGAVAYTGVLVDVSSRSEEEERRVHSQKLEALGSLAGGIAHDFNNLIFAITGNIALAREEIDGNAELEFIFDEVQAAADRATDLVRRIFAFSRPEAEELRPTALAALAAEAIKLTRATVPKLTELELDVQSGVPPVGAYSGQLHQVLVNLITNASHAIGSRPGRIRVAVGVAAADAEDGLAGRPSVTLEVSDDGSGMSEETRARIFEPYFTTKPQDRGTGLGLAVVASIIENHGGTIAVASELGKGTTFRIVLPAMAPKTVARRERRGAVSRGGGQRVLYVDDEPAISMVAERVLQTLGYQARCYVDPTEAVLDFERRPQDFDAVVTDLDMPRMGGLTLMARIRGHRPDIPVIVSTGLTLEDEALMASLEDVVVIEKADMRTQLGRALADALRRGG